MTWSASRGGRPDLFDEPVPRKQAPVDHLRAGVVHRHEHLGMANQERGHVAPAARSLATTSDGVSGNSSNHTPVASCSAAITAGA